MDAHIVSPQSCRRLSRPEPIAKEMLCAGHFQGRKGFCEVRPPVGLLPQSSTGPREPLDPSGPVSC